MGVEVSKPRATIRVTGADEWAVAALLNQMMASAGWRLLSISGGPGETVIEVERPALDADAMLAARKARHD